MPEIKQIVASVCLRRRNVVSVFLSHELVGDVLRHERERFCHDVDVRMIKFSLLRRLEVQITGGLEVNDLELLGLRLIPDPLPGVLPELQDVVACLALKPFIVALYIINTRRTQETSM